MSEQSSTDVDTVTIQQDAKSSARLIEIAITNGCTPEQLATIVGLHERMEATRADREFSQAMNACQSETPVIVRDRANPNTKSRFASLDQINKICHPIYTKHGFAISFREAPATREGWIRTQAEVTHVGGGKRLYERELPRDGVGPKGEPIGKMNAPQSVCSTNTYACRRLICEIFNITIADEDDDGNAGGVITGEMIGEINDLIVECRNAGASFDLDRFLKAMDAESLDKIPMTDHGLAIHFLKQKIEQAKKAKRG